MKNKKRLLTPSVKNILKTTIIAPTISIGAISIVYAFWWIFSKLFYIIHTWMSGSVWPWFKGAWGYIIGIWIFIIITSIIYTVVVEKKNARKQKSCEQEQKNEEINKQIKETLREAAENWDSYFSEQCNQSDN